MLKKILYILFLGCALQAYGQTVMQSRIYVCTGNDGGLRLHNLSLKPGCLERVISVPVTAHLSGRRVEASWRDPVPARQALTVDTRVPTAIQAKRDVSRIRILESELRLAQSDLILLERALVEASDGLKQGFKSTNSSAQIQDLRNKIYLAQANIDALQRELEREK